MFNLPNLYRPAACPRDPVQIYPRSRGQAAGRHKWILWKFLFLLIFCNSIYSLNVGPYPFSSTDEITRFQSLTKEIRCVVCQNQSIADSNAPLANDLREKIYQMILNKQSDSEIKDYLVKRYGEFILLEPRLNKLTAILWMFPLIAVIFIFFILSRQKKLERITERT